jgi:hypothetical protein
MLHQKRQISAPLTTTVTKYREIYIYIRIFRGTYLVINTHISTYIYIFSPRFCNSWAVTRRKAGFLV